MPMQKHTTKTPTELLDAIAVKSDDNSLKMRKVISGDAFGFLCYADMNGVTRYASASTPSIAIEGLAERMGIAIEAD